MTSVSFVPLMISVSAFGLCIMIQLVVWNIVKTKGYGFLLSALMFLSFIVICAASRYFFGISVVAYFWESVSVYCFICMLYFLFYFGVDRSVSIRILNDIVESNKKSLTKCEIIDGYSFKDMVETRLESMVEASILEKRNLEFELTERGKVLAIVSLGIFKVYNIKTSG